jgi:hypothetical protein
MGSAPTVAVAAVGDPESPATWSGTSAGILAGLRELGIATRALDLKLPRGLEQALLVGAAASTRNRYDAESAALTSRVRSMRARRLLADEAVDGVIQIGTTFALPPATRYVTLEDMTVRQGASSHPVFSRMSEPARASWERRRARLYERARMCAVSSHWAGESLRRDYGLAPARVAVVGLGANHRASGAERDWSTPRYLFVGIDWQRKGGPQVLRAFSAVREVHPDALLDVVGGHPPLREPGVNGHGVLAQTLARDRRRALELFARATCFVMPSAVEPFGIVYIEAASSGLPSIATSVGGPRDLVGEDGGVVVEPGDERALVQAMLKLADPSTARRMGAAARQRAELYTWPKVAERLLRALGLALPDDRPPAAFL